MSGSENCPLADCVHFISSSGLVTGEFCSVILEERETFRDLIMTTTSSSIIPEPPKVEKVVPKLEKVVVHPLVLLSVVDHFNRMGKVGNVKRVVGVLLGSNRQGILDVSNSFAGKQWALCGFGGVVSCDFDVWLSLKSVQTLV